MNPERKEPYQSPKRMPFPGDVFYQPLDPFDYACKRVIKEEIEKLLEGLTQRQREVIVERFGLGGEEQRSLREIGNKLGLTPERVRQIEKDALEKLRNRRNKIPY
ncbi:MAG: sigma-70 family RNA polymerase sigma factor [Microgenomates group bacterium]